MPFFLKYRVLFVEPHEDIDEIINHIQTIRDESVALVVPRGSTLLASIISLKILRNAVEEKQKDFAVVSRDPQAREFCDRLDILWTPDIEALESELWQKISTPPSAEKTCNFVRRRFSEMENIPQKKEWEEKKRDLLNRLQKPKKGVLLALGILSLVLLLFVATIALPGATLKITPQKKVVETTITVTLDSGSLENETDSWRKAVIAAVPLETIIEETISFPTVSFFFTGKNASGNIRIKNESAEEITLRPNTQFVTEEGISFRAKDWSRIPAKGEAIVAVGAEEEDIFGKMVGVRGNLEPPLRMKLPKIPSQISSLVYAEVFEPLTGGIDGRVPRIAERDFQVAKNQISETLRKEATENLKSFLDRRNKLEDKDFVFVYDDRFLKTEILDLEMPNDLLGSEVDSFPVRARMRFSAIAYSRAEMRSVLRGALEKSISPGMELMDFEDGNLLPEIVSSSEKRIKLSVSVRGVQRFIIESRTAEGVAFVNRVKDTIAGKPIDEAKKLLENFTEVAAVDIAVWPPFVLRVPRLSENISVALSE